MSGKASPKRRQLRLARCLLGAVWLVIIVLCLLHREDFTLEGILTYSPRHPALAAALLLAVVVMRVFPALRQSAAKKQPLVPYFAVAFIPAYFL